MIIEEKRMVGTLDIVGFISDDQLLISKLFMVKIYLAVAAWLWQTTFVMSRFVGSYPG